MITLITGAPGAGKTAALVAMLETLGKDRPIFVHGIPELTINHVVLEDPATWCESVPDGAVIVIDEVQTVWRPSGPGQKIPDHIAKLETHRHRGLDFYIITQGPNLVHANVRALVGRHVHLRDIGLLGRWWYEWPETADNCRTGWKNAPLKKRYRLPKKVFGTYKSASLHVKPVRSFPTTLVVLLAAIIGVGWLSWSMFGTINQKAFGGKPVSESPVSNVSNVLSGKAPPVSLPAFIDDRIAFIPRVSDKPETAPAYDTMRVVVNMPLVVGGMCFKGVCKCVTQQGTDAGLSHALCKKWMDNPPFDPYRLPPPPPRPAPAPELVNADAESPSANRRSARRENEPAQPVSVGEAPMPSGPAINARAEARSPSVLPPGSPVHTTQPTDAAGIIPPPSLLSPYRRS